MINFFCWFLFFFNFNLKICQYEINFFGVSTSTLFCKFFKSNSTHVLKNIFCTWNFELKWKNKYSRSAELEISQCNRRLHSKKSAPRLESPSYKTWCLEKLKNVSINRLNITIQHHKNRTSAHNKQKNRSRKWKRKNQQHHGTSEWDTIRGTTGFEAANGWAHSTATDSFFWDALSLGWWKIRRKQRTSFRLWFESLWKNSVIPH